MAVSWTTLPNGDVDVDSPLTTALMTALRDNPEGIAQRASGAPKIFGVAYDFQEFTADGTWTKPSNAESGDKLIVQVVGGGGGGAEDSDANNTNGGGGGAGWLKTFEDIDDFASTEAVVVGAGGSGGNPGFGGAGSVSKFGTSGNANYLEAGGGAAGTTSGTPAGGVPYHNTTSGEGDAPTGTTGGTGGSGSLNNDVVAGASTFGGGGGGRGAGSGEDTGGASMYAGHGGKGSGTSGTDSGQFDGIFPGGGGGGVDTGYATTGGDGGDGVVRVWCIKEE